MRWVACGNLEPRKPEEDNFSSGADSSALRILVWCAARLQWLASTLDVRTAFLNATMVLSEDENLILVKPPALLTEKIYLRKDVYYLPEKATYGLRRSPKLRGQARDETITDFDIHVDSEGKITIFNLELLQSEPNLWKLCAGEDERLHGLLMTYVDDILVAAQRFSWKQSSKRYKKLGLRRCQSPSLKALLVFLEWNSPRSTTKRSSVICGC